MTLLPIPATETATDPIHSPTDLQQRWRALMGPLGFGERLLRFVFVGPDRCFIKVLSEVEIGRHPDPLFVDNLMWSFDELIRGMGDGHSVALLLTRPGRGGPSVDDRRWCSALTAAAQRLDVPMEQMFCATDETLVPVTARASVA